MYHWSWFDLAFPWLGSVAAVILLGLLFATGGLRQRRDVSRWRDPAWLGWLLTAVYLVHNIEEYGLDAIGQWHQFPAAMCDQLGLPPYPHCVIPPLFYLCVNISLVWVAAPLLALLARRNPVFGLSMLGVIAINAVVHFVPVITSHGYNPGLLTAVLLFIPITVWGVKAAFGRGRLPYRALVAFLAGGVLVHVCLMASVMLYARGLIDAAALDVVQVLNPLWLFVLPGLAGRKTSTV